MAFAVFWRLISILSHHSVKWGGNGSKHLIWAMLDPRFSQFSGLSMLLSFSFFSSFWNAFAKSKPCQDLTDAFSYKPPLVRSISLQKYSYLSLIETKNIDSAAGCSTMEHPWIVRHGFLQSDFVKAFYSQAGWNSILRSQYFEVNNIFPCDYLQNLIK